MSDTPRTDELIQAWMVWAQGQHDQPMPKDYVVLARELEREVAALRKDAERYRWLRDMAYETDEAVGKPIVGVMLPMPYGAWSSHSRAFEAAIDAALGSPSEPTPPRK